LLNLEPGPDLADLFKIVRRCTRDDVTVDWTVTIPLDGFDRVGGPAASMPQDRE